MDINNNIQKKIDSSFEALDAIAPVNVSPFFKDKTLNVLFAEREEQQTTWSWFTPKLQLATLICVVVLNVIAFTKLQNASSYEDNLGEFAESYGLSTIVDETSILN